MEETSTPPRAVEKVSRLAAPQRRRLKQLLSNAELSGERITLPLVRESVALEFGVSIADAVASKLLAEFGYYQSQEVDPVALVEGSSESVYVWLMGDRARPLSPAQKAQALSERMKVLSDAFVEDLLDDALLHFGTLDDIAIEATRSFAISLSEAAQKRARIGSKQLLSRCGEVAQMSFKSALSN